MKFVMAAAVLVILMAGVSLAVEPVTYPLEVPGAGTFSVPRGQTFWVLKDSQYKMALTLAMTQEVDSLRAVVLQEKLEVFEMLVANRDSMIGVYRQGYTHYRDLWQVSDAKLEEAEIQASQRFTYFQVGFWVGALTAGVIAIAGN